MHGAVHTDHPLINDVRLDRSQRHSPQLRLGQMGVSQARNTLVELPLAKTAQLILATLLAVATITSLRAAHKDPHDRGLTNDR
jgi:hypothetical protein